MSLCFLTFGAKIHLLEWTALSSPIKMLNCGTTACLPSPVPQEVTAVRPFWVALLFSERGVCLKAFICCWAFCINDISVSAPSGGNCVSPCWDQRKNPKTSEAKRANFKHMEVCLLWRLLLNKIKCGVRSSIQPGTERKVRMQWVYTVFAFFEKGEGRQDDQLARTHPSLAQPVFFKIRPSFRVAKLS